jgi:type VI secretion system protein ImpB
MPESIQHKLGRVRPPRVQITYSVETNGSPEDKHLPFVAGIFADLSGDNEKSLPNFKERKFEEIDRDNINDVLKNAQPGLRYSVPNTLTGEGNLRVDLKFESMNDFGPAQVAEQVPALRELLELRKRLDTALAKLQTNAELGDLLQDILSSEEKVKQMAREMGLEKPVEGGN